MLLLLLVACDGAPDLQPTAPDAIPEAHFDGPTMDRQFLAATGWLRAPALDAPDGATRAGLLVTLTHEGAPMPRFEARGRSPNGDIGPWQALHTTWREELQAVAIVDLAEVAEHVELRLPLSDRANVAHLTWSAVVPEPVDVRVEGEVGAVSQPLRSELAAIGVLSRAQWGARATRCTSTDPNKRRMAIHHTVTPASGDPAVRLRGIQNYHMDSRGWCDIGYHFLVSLDGRVWEGRSLGLLGTHVGGHNTGNIGVSYIGCFHSSSCASFPPNVPPEVMIDGGARVVGELGRIYGIAPTDVIGHRDHSGASTSCPGDHLHRRLGDIRTGGTPPGPVYGAAYVAQSFPLARDPFELEGGAEVAGYLEMRNTGTANWAPGETFLGTTEPRDGPSRLAASDWISPHRAATIDRVVAPGETGRFVFSVRAPSDLGDYPQFFNVVQEGVAWFGDAGHRGPADDQIQIRVTVTSLPEPMVDAGVGSDAGTDTSDAGAGTRDAGTLPRADGGMDVDSDAGVPSGGMVDGGCGCATTDGASGSFALAFLALFALRRRR